MFSSANLPKGRIKLFNNARHLFSHLYKQAGFTIFANFRERDSSLMNKPRGRTASEIAKRQ